MLITHKLTKDKRPVVDFRLLNTRRLRSNTATPLINYFLLILGNSKCETLSCIDLKMPFTVEDLWKDQKSFVEFCPILVVPILAIKFCLWAFQCHHANGWSISKFY